MKTLRILLCVLPLLLIGLPVSFGCSCVGQDTFCETMAGHDNDPSFLVIKGKKIANVEHGMDVEVLEVYYGEEQRSVIRVWGDNGFLCRVYPSVFGIGEEFIFGLQRIEEDYTGENPPAWLAMEQENDYIISVCGVYYFRWSDLDDPTVESPEDCLPVAPTPCDFSTGKNFTVYPNPAQGRVFLNLHTGDQPVKGTIQLYDTGGRRVGGRQPLESLLQNGRFALDVSHYAPGVYLVKINSPGYCGEATMAKVVVM